MGTSAIRMIKSTQAPRVFISYAHESESHNENIFELSERLRSEGVDCYIDQYEISPAEGWPRWSRNQIQQADFVLVVCTETYKSRFEGSEVHGKGAGAKWEGAIITQELYDSEDRNTKFIPIVFDSEDLKYIPVEMRGGTYYILNSGNEYEDLYRHLTNQPKAVKRDLGRLRSLLPSREKRLSLQACQSKRCRLKRSHPNLNRNFLLLCYRVSAGPLCSLRWNGFEPPARTYPCR